MPKVIHITEGELMKIIKSVISEQQVYTDHDKIYDYKLENNRWYTRKKINPNGKWFDITDRSVAVERLNKKYGTNIKSTQPVKTTPNQPTKTNQPSVKTDLIISDSISSKYRNKIDYDSLRSNQEVNKIVNPGTLDCADFINKFTDKLNVIGNAWHAYDTSSVGKKIFTVYNNLTSDIINKYYDVYLKITKGASNKEVAPFIKNLQEFLIKRSPKPSNLQLDDVVGIYYAPSSHHKDAFIGAATFGKGYYPNDKIGKTLSSGIGHSLNSHVGIVGAIKDGVPLIFHNIYGNVKSTPANMLPIVWVKRPAGQVVSVNPTQQTQKKSVVDPATPFGRYAQNVQNTLMEQQISQGRVERGLIGAEKKKFDCLNPNHSLAVEYVIGEGIPVKFVRYAYGILGRESDFGQSTKYTLKSSVEYFVNKLSETSPLMKSIIKNTAKVVLQKDNWVPSMGIAQMTPHIAKQYGVNLEKLMSFSGSLLAVSKHLMDLYKLASRNFDTNKPSVIIYNHQLITNPSTSGDGAMDAAIVSYNLGSQLFNKNYCQTNSTDYMAPCQSPDGVFRPFPQSKPNFVIQVYPQKVVKNYLPNIKTNTGNVLDKVLDKTRIKNNTNFISSHGYLKEVVGYAKKFSCIS